MTKVINNTEKYPLIENSTSNGKVPFYMFCKSFMKYRSQKIKQKMLLAELKYLAAIQKYETAVRNHELGRLGEIIIEINESEDKLIKAQKRYHKFKTPSIFGYKILQLT